MHVVWEDGARSTLGGLGNRLCCLANSKIREPFRRRATETLFGSDACDWEGGGRGVFFCGLGRLAGDGEIGGVEANKDRFSSFSLSRIFDIRE